MKLSGRLETLEPIPPGVERNLTPSLFMYSESLKPRDLKNRNMFADIRSAGGLPRLFFDRANPPICEAELDFDRSNPKTKT
jgi:hypothetical protein